MKLIKETGSKPTTPGNPKTSRKHAIFECPVCNTHIEKPISDGTINKTCGDKVCRKEAFSFNYAATYNTKKDPISSKVYYDPIRKVLNHLKKYKLIASHSTIDKFYETSIEEFTYMKSLSPNGSVITVVTEGSEVRFIPTGPVVIKDMSIFTYSCSSLNSKDVSFRIGIKHDTVVRASERLSAAGVIVADKVSIKTNTIGGNLSKGWVYSSKDDYNKVITALKFVSTRKVADTVYLIKGAGLIKIGVTSDLKKRVKGIATMSPVPVKLLHSYTIQNAREVEKFLHTKYADSRKHGEWFDLGALAISDIVNYLKSR